MMENPNGLVGGATLTEASGLAERSALVVPIGAMAARHRSTGGADKGQGAADLVAGLRTFKATPHVVRNIAGRRCRKRRGEVFGWTATVAGETKSRCRTTNPAFPDAASATRQAAGLLDCGCSIVNGGKSDEPVSRDRNRPRSAQARRGH